LKGNHGRNRIITISLMDGNTATGSVVDYWELL
jgi:hypothetical protein